MIASIVINLAVAALAVAAVGGHAKKSKLRVALRYFTSLSNLFCGAACLAVALCRLTGGVPWPVLAWKYVGTVSVMVTFLTVMLFLGPHVGYRPMLSGSDFWLHLVCPLLALLSYLVWDRTALPFAAVLLGLLPVALYGALYFRNVVAAGTWKDFYGFNRGGRWHRSLAVMLAGTLGLSVLLWAI